MMNPRKYFEAMLGTFDTTKMTELYYTNEFTLAVAVILSAQTTDKRVNIVAPGLFKDAGTPEKMLALGLDGLKEHIKSLSFFNNKAANVIKLSEQLSGIIRDNAAWKFPDMYHNRDALMALGGIGRKTANVITSILWGAKNVGVDTHVFRLAHRFGWADAADNTPEKVEKKILEIIPDKYLAAANHLMVMHGRYVCKALKPDCEKCPVAELCGCKKEYRGVE